MRRFFTDVSQFLLPLYKRCARQSTDLPTAVPMLSYLKCKLEVGCIAVT
jgi:hypothetical protein